MSIYMDASLMLVATLGAIVVLARGLQMLWSGPAGAFRRAPAAGKRLAVEETCTVDGRRRLVLLRFDDRHLVLLTGGPSDLVVFPASCASGREA